MLRKNADGKFKKYYHTLLGSELYVYKSKEEATHKQMNSLAGVFIKDEPVEKLDSKAELYPFKLIYPGNKERIYYLQGEAEKVAWVEKIKEVIGYCDVQKYYKTEKTLGHGKFGLVKLATHIKTGKNVAIKVIDKSKMNEQDHHLLHRELEILKMCQHPHIVRLLDIFENHMLMYIVMEVCSGGDLFKYLDVRNWEINEDRARTLSHELATAIFYLHSYGIVHRDLKLENIIMSDDTEKAHLKLLDFGLSQFLGPSQTANDPFGTITFVAPEILQQKPYGQKIDIWSLGVITYILLTGSQPFDADEDSEIARQIIKENPDYSSSTFGSVSKDGLDFVKACLTKDQAKRPSIQEMLDHAWMAPFKGANRGKVAEGTGDHFKAYALT
jgi:serine/threonine protein kinase